MPEITELLGNMTTMIIAITCGGMLLTIVLIIVITRFTKGMIKKTVGVDQGVLQNGIPAQAKILNIQQTGVMLNNQPQVAFDLEVYQPGRGPYRAQAKAVIPIVNIPQYQPGVEVPVKVDPNNPAQVVLDIYA